MHSDIQEWLANLRYNYLNVFKTDKVLECGSLNINGSVRPFFNVNEYVGLDWRAGKDVDVVSIVHKYHDKPNGYFNTVISSSLLEHDPFWQLSLERMVDLLADGGSMILTFGGPGWPHHETDCAPIAVYYGNRDYPEVVSTISRFARFRSIHIEAEVFHPADIKIFCLLKIPKEGATNEPNGKDKESV